MKNSSSKRRARAASPFPAAAAAAAKGADDDRQQQQHLASPQATHLVPSPVLCDAFYGFPFGAGVCIGRVLGMPLRLLGFIFYAITVIPRFTSWAQNFIRVAFSRDLVRRACYGVRRCCRASFHTSNVR